MKITLKGCFPVNFAKFLRAPFLQNTSGRLLLNGKASKVMISLPFSYSLETVREKINELKCHLFIRNEQIQLYNNLKLQMSENTIPLRVGYAENYENKQQDECQSAYFGHKSFSIFSAAPYIRLNGKTEK